MQRPSRPARLGRWLLGLRAGVARRAEVEADLVELFHLRAAERGRAYAQRRWLRDAISIARPGWPAPPRRPRDHVMQVFWGDLRVAIRASAAHRRFTAIAVGVLALGIGVTTAVFSVVNAVLLRPLPYPNQERLVAVTGMFKTATRTVTSPVVALTDMASWRQRAQSFESLGAFAYTQLPIRVGDRSFSPVTALMDPEFLPTLGTAMALGTFFEIGYAPGSDTSAIVSHALWQEAFGGDRAAIGRTISIDGEPYVLRGVLPADFQFPRSDASYFTKPVGLLLPAASYPGFPAASAQWFGIARLKPDVSVVQAQSELRLIAEALSTNAESGESRSVQLAPLADETTKRAREPLLIVMGISIVLLLIASTNLMNLFFARGVARLREMSIRRAIGSTTWQLLRLLLTESLLLAIVGGALGIWLASFAIRAIVAFSPVHLPVTEAIDIDGTVLAFTMLLCVGTAIAAGFFPALHVSTKTDETVRSPGMRASAGRGVIQMQQALCVTQIALGMALLTAAGLLANSLWRLNRVDPGFDADRVLGFNLSVPNDVSRLDRVRFYDAALQEIRTIPGVERAGLISFLPPEMRAGVFMGLAVEGADAPEPGAPPRRVNTLVTSVDYFRTMRMPVLQGRDLTEADAADRPPVIVVNEAFVRRYFPAADPIGRHIGTGFDGLKPVREIVGVVKDSHDRGLAVAPFPTVYIPFRQFALPYGAIAVRSTIAADGLIPVIRDRLHRLNPAVPLSDFETIDGRLRESLREPRFYTLMALTCAAMAVLFVTFGLYGLVSYSVGRRTTELGIRMAIGAQRGAILRMVLGQGLRMAMTGVTLGVGITLIFSRALASLLFGVEPVDPPTFAVAAALVILVTLAASYAPARRASRVNPIAALRHD
jgi:putative ABC transport system permease protein